MSLQRNYCTKCTKAYDYEPGVHDDAFCFACLSGLRDDAADEFNRLESERDLAEERLGDSEDEVTDLQTQLKAREIELKGYTQTIIKRDNIIENRDHEIKKLKEELVELEEATKLLTEVLEGQTNG